MSKFSLGDIEYALTFDDILLVPQYSEVVPTEISPRSEFARNIVLNAPILSAAMDTVTENKMARVMAQQGGLGIIHKNLTVDGQALEAEKVKKYESGMITDPITLGPDRKVKDALELMKRYSISGVPITVDGKLVGILTNRDLRFETNVEQLIGTVMTKEKLVTAEIGTTLEQAKQILQKHRIEKLPVVDKNGMRSTYNHNSRVSVEKGDKVAQGETIALVGSTGWSTGPHLDLRIQMGGRFIDPLDVY